MPIDFQCPNCSQTLSAPDEAGGQSGKCRFCGATVKAPAISGESAELIAPGAPAPPAPPPSMPGTDASPNDNPMPGPGAIPGGYTAPPAEGGGIPAGYGYGYAAPTYPSQPLGEVNPGAIVSEAWSVTASNWGILAGGVVIAGVMIYGASMAMMLFMMPSDQMRGFESGQALTEGFPWPFMVGMWAVMFLLSPLMLGPFSMADEILTKGGTTIGTLFAPYRRFGRLLGTILIITLIASLVASPFWGFAAATVFTPNAFISLADSLSPMFWIAWLIGMTIEMYVMLGLYWAVLEVLDKDAAPMDAIRASWEAARGKRWLLFVTYVLLSLIYMAGALVCWIGALFTLPVAIVGFVITYRQLRGLEGNV